MIYSQWIDEVFVKSELQKKCISKLKLSASTTTYSMHTLKRRCNKLLLPRGSVERSSQRVENKNRQLKMWMLFKRKTSRSPTSIHHKTFKRSAIMLISLCSVTKNSDLYQENAAVFIDVFLNSEKNLLLLIIGTANSCLKCAFHKVVSRLQHFPKLNLTKSCKNPVKTWGFSDFIVLERLIKGERESEVRTIKKLRNEGTVLL